jgi:hypothetical protein
MKIYCPYCQIANELIPARFEVRTPHVIYCNQDEGGCDRQFLIELVPQPPLVNVASIGLWAPGTVLPRFPEAQESHQEPL